MVGPSLHSRLLLLSLVLSAAAAVAGVLAPDAPPKPWRTSAPMAVKTTTPPTLPTLPTPSTPPRLPIVKPNRAAAVQRVVATTPYQELCDGLSRHGSAEFVDIEAPGLAAITVWLPRRTSGPRRSAHLRLDPILRTFSFQTAHGEDVAVAEPFSALPRLLASGAIPDGDVVFLTSSHTAWQDVHAVLAPLAGRRVTIGLPH